MRRGTPACRQAGKRLNMSSMFYTYVVKSAKYKYLYIGHTSNIEKRLRERNYGKTRSNKRYKPFILVYYEEFTERSDAIKQEKNLKMSYNREELRKLAFNGEVPKRLKGRVC